MRDLISLLAGAGVIAGFIAVAVLHRPEPQSGRRGNGLDVSGRLALPPGVDEAILTFVSLAGGEVTSLTVGRGQTYSATVPGPGLYSVGLGTVPYMLVGERRCTVHSRENHCDLLFAATNSSVRVRRADGGRIDNPVSITLRGPVSSTKRFRVGFVRPDELGKLSLLGLDPGSYSIVAHTADGLTSQHQSVITVPGPAAVDLVLARRPLTLRVEDAAGTLIETAQVTAGTRSIRGVRGVFDGLSLPDGEEVEVTALGFLPTCTIVEADDGSQIVRLTRLGKDAVRITLRPAATRPMGVLHGLPGASCGARLTAEMVADATVSEDGAFEFTMTGLPRGAYLYQANDIAPLKALTVPRSAFEYIVPPDCVACG